MSDRILDQACRIQSARLQSNEGNGARDITADFTPFIQGYAGAQYFVACQGGQNSDSGVAINVGAFLCTPDMNVIPEGGDNKLILAPDGGVDPRYLGAFISSDGSAGQNWGPMFFRNAEAPIVVPVGWFLRFTTFLGATIGFPAMGAQFRVHLTYYVKDLR